MADMIVEFVSLNIREVYKAKPVQKVILLGAVPPDPTDPEETGNELVGQVFPRTMN